MTKQEQNDIIIQHINSELRDAPNINTRVGMAFNKWFQSLIIPPAPPAQEEPVEDE
jgi:hypothetical protein